MAIGFQEGRKTVVQEKIGLGATYLGEGRCQFRVWAPPIQKMEVRIVSPEERIVPLNREGEYHQVQAEKIEPGSLYFFRLDGQKERPDPASRFQPQGVHNPSAVVDPTFPWEDGGWSGLPLKDYLIYEIHVGTFTPAGTFESILPHLDELKDLGITAVELMPVAQFPGNRNWGYDGVHPFAVQNSYGGPQGFKKLINACHQRSLAVILDVVYNHLGPEGNYLQDFGPYFTDRYRTYWGSAINFDGPYSDEVRRFFIANALYWVSEFHLDALRIDAVHAILDFSAQPFLGELAQAVQEQAERLNRQIHLIAESDLDDSRLVRSRECGGFGLDAQWNDDFHHALHTLLTGERAGYYQDFGEIRHLVKAFREGFVYSGDYSLYRHRRHGNSSRDLSAFRFVVFAQNHDQIGNRAPGDRLSEGFSLEKLKLAAGVVLLSPFIPLLFMGEEYGEQAPFQYFVSHSDPGLVEAVRRGRRREFATFKWKEEPPDPQDEVTFLRSKLNPALRHEKNHRLLLKVYKELIRLRQTIPPLALLSKDQMEAIGFEQEKILFIRRWKGDEEIVILFHFGDSRRSLQLPIPAGRWRKGFDSGEERWGGEGSRIPADLKSNGQILVSLGPRAFALFARVEEV
jgi:maltooligosyltrehalose trehalohydrolase